MKPQLQEDFEAEKYTGTWHEFQRSKSIPFEEGECITADYQI